MRKMILPFIALATLALVSCIAEPSPLPTPVVSERVVPVVSERLVTVTREVPIIQPTGTPAPTYTPYPTPEPWPTYTPHPTPEPWPTHTPHPTPKPWPTHTPHPTPKPLPTASAPDVKIIGMTVTETRPGRLSVSARVLNASLSTRVWARVYDDQDRTVDSTNSVPVTSDDFRFNGVIDALLPSGTYTVAIISLDWEYLHRADQSVRLTGAAPTPTPRPTPIPWPTPTPRPVVSATLTFLLSVEDENPLNFARTYGYKWLTPQGGYVNDIERSYLRIAASRGAGSRISCYFTSRSASVVAGLRPGDRVLVSGEIVPDSWGFDIKPCTVTRP